MFLKRLVYALLIGSFAGSCCVPSIAEEIVVYSGDSFQPQIYLVNGKPAGYVAALFERISRDTGDTYRFTLLPWKRAVSESAAGLGGISNFSWTPERARSFDYSDPVFVNRSYLLVKKGHAFPFASLNDLRGKRIGALLGSSYGDEFDRAAENKLFIVDYDSNEVLRLKKLLIGRFDAAIVELDTFNLMVNSDPELAANKDEFTFLPKSLIDDKLYLAFPKSMHMLPALKRFNLALNALKKTREYQKIINENRL